MLKLDILLAFLMCLCLTYTFKITSVSIYNPLGIGSFSGSIMGGTKLKFNGSGFSTIAS